MGWLNLTFEKLLWRGGGGNDLSFFRRGWGGLELFLRLGQGPSPGRQSKKPLVFLAQVPSGESLSLCIHTRGAHHRRDGVSRWSRLQSSEVRAFHPPFNS